MSGIKRRADPDIFFQHRRSNWRDAHLRARRIRRESA